MAIGGSVVESKKEIRKRILEKRNNLSKEEIKEKSQIISDKLFSLDEYKKANNVLIFISYKSEVDTSLIIERSIGDSKKVYAPRVCGDDMRFFEIKAMADVKEGYKGIFEPEINEDKEYLTNYPDNYDESDLIIMPGAVIDYEGNRIGYGKGFYDRYLSHGFRGIKLVTIFDLQLVPDNTFKADSNDVKVDCILTEMNYRNIF